MEIFHTSPAIAVANPQISAVSESFSVILCYSLLYRVFLKLKEMLSSDYGMYRLLKGLLWIGVVLSLTYILILFCHPSLSHVIFLH
jgi:hypothetical protein